jgi:valyl-tRNA synthetase
VLAHVLEVTLRLAAPLLPFVTEAAWRPLTGATGGRASLMVAPWPTVAGRPDPAARADFAVIQGLVREVNRFRSQLRIAPSVRLDLAVAVEGDARAVVAAHAGLIRSLAGLGTLAVVTAVADAPGTSTIVFPDGRAQVRLEGVIDVAAEVARLARERDRALFEAARLDERLANESFVTRAPTEVVAKEQAKRDDAVRVAAELAAQLVALGGSVA